jgi:hypothetical protein
VPGGEPVEIDLGEPAAVIVAGAQKQNRVLLRHAICPFLIHAGWHWRPYPPVRLTLSIGIINRISEAEQSKASFVSIASTNDRLTQRRKGTETKRQKDLGQKDDGRS